MRTSLGLTILGMGLLGMFLVIITSEVYQQFALNNQQDIFYERSKLKVDAVLEDAVNNAIKIGIATQGNPNFKQLFGNASKDNLLELLDQQFQRAPVTLNHVQLSKIYALDKEFNSITSSTEGHRDFSGNAVPCQDLISKSSQRQGASQLKPASSLCIVNNNPYIAAITPIGDLPLQGYLLVLTDPVFSLINAEKKLDFPIRLSLPGGQLVTQSTDWPQPQADNIFFSEYKLQTPDGRAYLNVFFATGVSNLMIKLANTRKIILISGAVITLFITLLALLILQRTAISPLKALSRHLRQIREDKSNIGNQLEIIGSAEIAGLTVDFNDMSKELRSLYNTLESMAFSDPLTNMANRALFYNRLEQASSETERYNTSFAIFVMDLDRFKNINDTLGHHIGDLVLQEIARRLMKIERKSDTVARLGGDEFAFLLPAIENETSIKMAANKVIEALSSPVIIEPHRLYIGASIGIVLCPHNGTEASGLMRRADIAMYQAKKKGEDFVFYTPAMNSQNLFELTIEAELENAISSDNFELHYQPKIDIAKKSVVGAEALIRWLHPEHGLIMPDKFIPLAEQSGMINQVTQWVLDKAVQQCAEWHSLGLKIGIAINLSAFSLNDSSLHDIISATLQKNNLPAQYLTLELTESAIMSDASTALKILTNLDSMGVRLAVDDFGTGYSSLAYLKRLPVDEIKIDKSFVMDMMENVNDEVIVRSTIDLAHNMGMKVVAEGIENHQTWYKLSELHCDFAQGHYLSKPSSATELNQWLQQSPWGINK